MNKLLMRHHSSLLAFRKFSTANLMRSQENYIHTEYLVNNARVLLRMPTNGQVWFFIDKSMTIAMFKDKCRKEDPLIKNVEVRGTGKNAVSDDCNIFELLTKRTPLFLDLNNIQYQFDTQDTTPAEKSIQITENNPFVKHCADAGLGPLQTNTVSTIAAEIMKGVGEKSTVEDLKSTFIRESRIFSQPIMREQLYSLYSKKIYL